MLADTLLRHAILADASARVSTTGVHLHLAELHRLQGAALVRSGASPAEAQASVQRAIEVAQDQGAKSHELRAAMGMARLKRDHSRRSEARDAIRCAMFGLGLSLW
jgi:predicted ATPase